MIDSMLTTMIAVLVTLIISGLYGLASTALRKRVTIRSPESQAIEQIIPAVNALLEAQPSQMTALIAILEAQKGVCNGNVDSALDVTRMAKAEFDRFLLGQARIGG